MENPPLFNSVEDECRYWKERAKLFHKEWTDVKQEFDEFVEQSREMEAEMDASLEQKLADKLDSHNVEYANVEKQLENMKKERDSMKEYLRQLEQKNDDLERAHRILNESIVDFERMLDKAYEKNALLEMEVDEKEILQEKLQRLMDETRADLKQELNVKTRYSTNNSTTSTITKNDLTASTTDLTCTGIVNGELLGDTTQHITNCNNAVNHITSNGTTIIESATNINEHQRSLKRKPYNDPANILNGNAMSASSRTTALNIVADMLRKLNAMETKLKTYREQGSGIQPRQ
uniref:NUDE domain-containing protein n=1 Tax=Glossina brevipalpis TaxID=37001 RepID=A0A1A9WE31_9MUSC